MLPDGGRFDRGVFVGLALIVSTAARSAGADRNTSAVAAECPTRLLHIVHTQRSRRRHSRSKSLHSRVPQTHHLTTFAPSLSAARCIIFRWINPVCRPPHGRHRRRQRRRLHQCGRLRLPPPRQDRSGLIRVSHVLSGRRLSANAVPKYYHHRGAILKRRCRTGILKKLQMQGVY